MRQIYQSCVPYEIRYWLYKLRHWNEVDGLRHRVFPSPKGDFSLRAFDRNQCIFIHITKSAGTSASKSLFNELTYHYTAIQYRVIFGRRRFNRYFKFAFVRNPWDRLYSAYCYLKGGGWNDQDKGWFNKRLGTTPDFESFVLEWLSPERLSSHLHLRPQIYFICDRRGHPLLDFVGYFETLPEDFEHVTQQLGIDASLSHVNASQRGDYRDAYSPEAIEKVRQLYAEDIANFGYDFDGLRTRMTIRRRRFEPL